MAAPFKTRKGVSISGGATDAGRVVITADNGRIDDSFLPFRNLQIGSTAADNTGTHSTVGSVSFARPFSSVPKVVPVLRQAQICDAGVPGTVAISSVSTTGFSFVINTNVDDTNAAWNINVAPVIDWFAFEVP